MTSVQIISNAILGFLKHFSYTLHAQAYQNRNFYMRMMLGIWGQVGIMAPGLNSFVNVNIFRLCRTANYIVCFMHSLLSYWFLWLGNPVWNSWFMLSSPFVESFHQLCVVLPWLLISSWTSSIKKGVEAHGREYRLNMKTRVSPLWLAHRYTKSFWLNFAILYKFEK